MLALCRDNAEVAVAQIKRATRSRTGIFLYALFSSIIGIFILQLFCGAVLSPMALTTATPVIIAFNAAMSGYALIDRGGNSFPYLKSSIAAITILLSAASVTSMITLYYLQPQLQSIVIIIATALLFTSLGAWIAFKNNMLKDDKPINT